MQYRKKPVTVRAHMWGGDGQAVVDFVRGTPAEHRVTFIQAHGDPELWLKMVDGNDVVVPMGAYLVLDQGGYPYPCDAEEFAKVHEPIPDGEDKLRFADRLQVDVDRGVRHALDQTGGGFVESWVTFLTYFDSNGDRAVAWCGAPDQPTFITAGLVRGLGRATDLEIDSIVEAAE